MNIDQKTYELINSYLSGELNGSKLDAFKARLKEEVDFRDKVEFQEAIIKGINEVRTQELKDFIDDNITKKKKYQGPVFRTGLSIAASIGIILFIFFSLKPFISSKSNISHTRGNINRSESIGELNDSLYKDNLFHVDSIISAKKLEDTQLIAKATSLEQTLIEKESGDNEAQENDIDNDIEEVMLLGDEDLAEDGLSMGKSLPTADIVANNAKPTSSNTLSTESDEIRNDSIIQKDQLLATSFTKIQFLSNTEEMDNIKATSDEVNELEDNNVARRNKRSKKSRRKKSTIQVEYWKSVVGFNGYKYDGSTLKLYGITPNEKIALSSLDNRLYLKMGNQFHSVERSNATHKFAPITNPILLKVLDE